MSGRAAAAETPVRVMLCDDSAVIRGALARMLEADARVRVVARAADGRQAVAALARQKVDVAVLDIEMPDLDGLAALPLLLQADPHLRVIMASTLTTRGADIALRALRLGAADYVPKPSVAAIGDDSFRRELLAKVLALGARPPRNAAPAPTLRRAAPRQAPALLAIGCSTGGPQALFSLLPALGARLPVPVVVTQHMPPTFTRLLAGHLDRLGALPCTEAEDGAALRPGHLYLAPGERHLLVEGAPGRLSARLSDGPAENFCRPAVDPMLRSAAAACGGRVLVLMLTGMGQDGLAGTRAVTEAGGTALAQDEASSVVWGMPGAVAQAGLCRDVLPLSALGSAARTLLTAAAA